MATSPGRGAHRQQVPMHFRRTLAATLAVASLAPAARAETPDPEFARFDTLLRHGALLEASGRGVSGWSLIGTGAGMGVVGGFMLASDDGDVREGGIWMGAGGIAIAALGLIPLFTTGRLEDLHGLWLADREVAPEQRAEVLARYEATLRELADDAGTIRVATSVVTAVLSFGLVGVSVYDMAATGEVSDSAASAAITGGFLLGLSLYGALGAKSQVESMWEAWDAGRPASGSTVTLAPGLGLRPDGFVLGLGGAF